MKRANKQRLLRLMPLVIKAALAGLALALLFQIEQHLAMIERVDYAILQIAGNLLPDDNTIATHKT